MTLSANILVRANRFRSVYVNESVKSLSLVILKISSRLNMLLVFLPKYFVLFSTRSAVSKLALMNLLRLVSAKPMLSKFAAGANHR